VGPHSIDAALGLGDDLGCRTLALDEPQQMRCSPPAEECALAGGQYSGQVRGLDAGRQVPDAVDAAVHADQVAPPQPQPDLIVRNPYSKQLRTGGQPMRGARDSRQFFFDRPV
jgi:hypothetical protein